MDRKVDIQAYKSLGKETESQQDIETDKSANRWKERWMDIDTGIYPETYCSVDSRITH
jgi:hypothetical protein